jgi:guanylate kinase
VTPDTPVTGAPRLLVLSGPSGVGKTTVVRVLRQTRPEVWVSVSATTRFPRPGERDGVHYRFVDRPTFEAMAAAGELLEWAEFAGNLYGTPRAAVEQHLAAGTPVVLEIEIEGARQVRRTHPDAVLVFLAPPSWPDLERRLVGRSTEGSSAVEQRLARARDELAAAGEFDVQLVNDDVERVCAELVALVAAGHEPA